METISTIVRNISIVILLASFMELLLPNSSMRRFVQLVMGLFVLMAILSPFSNLLELPLSFEIPAWSQSDTKTNEQELAQVLQQGQSIREKGQQAALEEYIKILERQAKALALTVKGVDQVSLEVVAKATGAIEQLKVYVNQGEAAIPPIQPVSGLDEPVPDRQNLNQEEKTISKEIKARLGTLLGVPEDKILVHFGTGQ